LRLSSHDIIMNASRSIASHMHQESQPQNVGGT